MGTEPESKYVRYVRVLGHLEKKGLWARRAGLLNEFNGALAEMGEEKEEEAAQFVLDMLTTEEINELR